MLEIGDSVEFVDEHGRSRFALVTNIFGDPDWKAKEAPPPSVNLVFVDPDEAKTDGYGRQLGRHTSVVHASRQGAYGMFWR